jgi:prepilin-type N-terminal cleavage/methylation domain-containing protein
MDNMKKRHAFTLIEMLVVIAIIGIVAALVINMNVTAQTKKKEAQVKGDAASLLLAINDYQSKLNFYPPDNPNVDSNVPGPIYDAYAATNPLIYELTGATNNYPASGSILLFDGTNTAPNFTTLFGRAGVNNANQDAPPQNFFNSGPQPKEYAAYAGGFGLEGLIVPVPISNDPTQTNFWHYDSSSTNRHNLQSFDLWAEYISANKSGSNIITTNGNW